MPQARKYASNADRQKAYRERQKAKATGRVSVAAQSLVSRVMAAEGRARETEK